MLHRPLRWAAALSLGALLAFAGTASADTLFADADTMTPIPDGSKHLGDVRPGGTVSKDISFLLLCAGLQHVDASQSVVLSWSDLGNEPLGGEIVSVTSVTFVLETAWAADSQGCPDPVPSEVSEATSRVTLRAPTEPGLHTYTIVWDRSLQPLGNNDPNAFSRTLTSVDLTLRVLPNAAPNLTVPASFEVEGNATGGWTADWSGVSATDPEDDPDPVPTCDPPAGERLSLDTTEVTCSVTDLAGATVSRSFNVTVVDTTRPTLLVPADISVTTNDPSGRVVTFDAPSASDVVDASPTVSCSHPSGFKFAVDTTTVTCTATDDRGNTRSASFDVTVDLEAPPQAASATWLEPVAGGGSTFEANRGRTLPVKVRLFIDGMERTSGDAQLTLIPCGGGTAIHRGLEWGGGRWNHSLDTSMLRGMCYDVTATIDGLAAGSFRLVFRGDEAATTKPASKSVVTGARGTRSAPDTTTVTTTVERRTKKPVKTSR